MSDWPEILKQYVRVQIEAGELRIGDQVLLDDRGEPWHVYQLDIVERGREHAVVSKAPNPHWDGPYLACATIRDKVTLVVPADAIPTPRPHGMRLNAHDPKNRGWYRDPGGWDVACACGWRVPDVVPGGRGAARDAWLQHKATELTALLAPGPRYGRPAAALVRLPANVGRYVYRRYRLIRLGASSE